MNSLFAIAASLAATIPVRVLTSLGIGVLSFAAFTAITDQLMQAVTSEWSGLGADVLTLLTMANIDDAIGMILGAIMVRVTYMTIPKLGILPGGGS